jgi:hypothetical protein
VSPALNIKKQPSPERATQESLSREYFLNRSEIYCQTKKKKEHHFIGAPFLSVFIDHRPLFPTEDLSEELLKDCDDAEDRCC